MRKKWSAVNKKRRLIRLWPWWLGLVRQETKTALFTDVWW